MEIQLIKFLQSNANGFFDAIFTVFSYFAGIFGFIIFALIIYFFIDKIYSLFFVFTYLFGLGFNYLLKIIIDRPRPYQVDILIRNILTALGRSMPSGHMLSVTIISVFVIFLIYKKCKSKRLVIESLICLVLFISLTALARMYLGQHYLSDLIVAFILGLMLSLLGILVYCKREKIYGYFKNYKEKRKLSKFNKTRN